MDLATLLGLVGAVGIILMAIFTGGEIGMFINTPSLLVVVGGTVGAVMMKFTLGQFLGAFKVALRAFIFKLDKPEELIAQTVEMANEARKGGLLALEGKETENDFLAKG
ncbi:MAG: flagellar motor protein PomA, partial [Gammaproteobacteria bacterium]